MWIHQLEVLIYRFIRGKHQLEENIMKLTAAQSKQLKDLRETMANDEKYQRHIKRQRHMAKSPHDTTLCVRRAKLEVEAHDTAVELMDALEAGHAARATALTERAEGLRNSLKIIA